MTNNITIPTTGDSWDLLEILAERTQPTDKVTVFLDEAASFTKTQLVQKYQEIDPQNKTARTAAKKAIEQVDAILDKRKFVFHLTGVPGRMREDIQSKALSEFPIKRTSIFDDDNARARAKRENLLIWQAQITGIENPDGKLRTDFTEEQLESIVAALPITAQNAVDEAIRDLNNASEQFTIESQGIDFS